MNLFILALLLHPTTHLADAAPHRISRSLAQCPDDLTTPHAEVCLPENQAEQRHKGYPDIPAVAPESPPFVKEPFTKLGIAYAPSGKLTATFNPAAFVTRDPADGVEKVFLVIRGEEDRPNAEWKKHSLPYLASSTDGVTFKLVQEEPLFTATDDYNKAGGIEDTRYMDLRKQPYVDPKSGKTYDGAYMYTAYDGKTARVAARVFNHDSPTKTLELGLLFPPGDVAKNPLVPENPGWNKSPSGLQFKDSVTGKIRNILYVGEGAADHGGIMALESDTPFGWKWPVDKKPVIQTRKGLYDELLVEPAFQPIITDLPPDLAKETGEKQGIVLCLHGDSPPKGYQVGFRIFSLKNPTGAPIYASNGPFLSPDRDYEIYGQVSKVVFASGGVFFKKGKKRMFFIYYGTADKYVGVAAADAVDGAKDN